MSIRSVDRERHYYTTMSPKWGIAAREIVRESDLQYVYTITADKDDLALDTRAVTLLSIAEGSLLVTSPKVSQDD